MAFRTSARLTLATLGVGALAGAGQLGVAYGLGIVRLTRVFDMTTRDQWTTQLAWVAWIAMTSVVVGGLFAVAARGDASARRTGPPAPPTPAGPGATATSAALARTGAFADRTWRKDGARLGAGAAIPLALAAGLGSAIVVLLTMQPARTAQIAGIHPVLVIGLTAGLGVPVGVFAAIAAMMHPVARWSLTTVGLIMWAIAIISVAPSLSPADPLPEIRLGVFDAGFLSHPTGQRIALLTMPVVALLVGLMLGAVARRQERSTLTIALAGLPGPALLTLAYLIAGPGTGTERYQVVPYWAAMTATGAGVLGSVLAVIIRRGPDDEDDVDRDGTAEQTPLPRREQQDESAIAKAATDPTGLGSTPGGPPSSGSTPGGPFPGSATPGADYPSAGYSSSGLSSAGYPPASSSSAGASSYAGAPSGGASKYAGYPSAGESPYGGGLDRGSDRTDWTVPDQRGSADAGRSSTQSAYGAGLGRSDASAGFGADSDRSATPSALGTGSAPWSGYSAGTATSTLVDDSAGTKEAARPGGFRGFAAGLRRRAAAPEQRSEPAAPMGAHSYEPAVSMDWSSTEPAASVGMRSAEPAVSMGMPIPTPLTTPPVAPPPIAPPPVAPPPVSPGKPASGAAPGAPSSAVSGKPVTPGKPDKRRSAKQQRRDEDYVDWVSGLGG